MTVIHLNECAVFLTGATGLLGSAILRRLERRGAKTWILLRTPERRALLAGCDFEWLEGDLNNPDSLAPALESFANAARAAGLKPLVIHSAAVISYRSADGPLQTRANVEGTAAMLKAAEGAGVERFLHVSSVVAVGHAVEADQVCNEETRFNSGEVGVDYVRTKRAAEELALSHAGRMQVVVTNPGAIFGPGPELSNTAEFLSLLRSPWLAHLAPPGGLSVVGVEDTAEGCLLALERGRPGRRYLLTESNWSHAELYAAARMVLTGSPARVFKLPRSLWRVVLFCARWVDRFFPAELAAPQALSLLALDYRFDSDRARSELGWRPRPFEQVLRQTYAWLEERDSGPKD